MRKLRGAMTVALALGMLASGAPGARALNLDGGVCQFNVTITFPGTGQKMKSIRVASSSPLYTMTLTEAIDLDAAASGKQNCVYPLGLLAPLRRSTVVAEATFTDVDLWTCELVQATGKWSQWWMPGPPERWLDTAFLLNGTWGAWELTIRENSQIPAFFSRMTLRFPESAKTASMDPACTNGSTGVQSLTLIGEQVFQDPSL